MTDVDEQPQCDVHQEIPHMISVETEDPLGVTSRLGKGLWAVRACSATACLTAEINRLGYGGRLFSDRWKAGTSHADKWAHYDGFELSFDVGKVLLASLALTAIASVGLRHFVAGLIDVLLFAYTTAWMFYLFLGMSLSFT